MLWFNTMVSLREIMKCYVETRQDMFYTKDAGNRFIGVDLYFGRIFEFLKTDKRKMWFSNTLTN